MYSRTTGISKQIATAVGVALLAFNFGAVQAQEGGYFSGVRFGASENAWSFTAPGLKLGQAMEYARARETGNTAFTGSAETRPNLNLDVVSAFNWRSSLSVFGKVGVGRGDNRLAPEWSSPTQAALDRTAISYGVGVRYDFTSSLGLKLELTRGTRFGMDRLRTDVDPDAVNVGIRWTF